MSCGFSIGGCGSTIDRSSFSGCGSPMGGCGASVRPSFSDGCSKGSSQRGVLCGNIRFLQPKIRCFMLPKEINLEEETVKFRVWKRGEKQDDIKLSFKEIRKYQKGEYDTDNKEYLVCGIKIDKNGEISFNKKYKDDIKELDDGKKNWKKFKELKDEIKTKIELEATTAEEIKEEEEDYEM